MTTSAIGGASAAPASKGSAPAAAALQAQLQRFQQQLSDCVNCSTAKTPEGKASIDAARAKISQVEQRIAQSDQVDARRQAAQRSALQPAAPSAAAGAASATAANSIDVYA